MEISTLWKDLKPNQERIKEIKKDIIDGKVPELPFFVIDQERAKHYIGQSIFQIDDSRMVTNLIVAHYGNGKTNILKFLQNKFAESSTIKVSFLRANVDQPDIFLFLLKEFQCKYLHLLIDAIKDLRQNLLFEDLTENDDSHFEEIREYVEALISLDNSDDEIKEFIYLGTGRLYTKASFAKHNIPQLKDYNRREVFAVFLNIISKKGIYIIFEIDEIEKIREKSKIRFNTFLTSYRELIDLSNKIKGHYLITSLTDGAGGQLIQEANQACYSRIKKFIIELEKIDSISSMQDLASKLNILFNKDLSTNKIQKLAGEVHKRKLLMNRDIIQHLSNLILEKENTKSLNDLLKEEHLNELFIDVKDRLTIEGSFDRIETKFFYPLRSYLVGKDYDEEYIKIQGDRLFIDTVKNKINYFIFKDNIEDKASLNNKVNQLVNINNKDLVIYSPEKLELSYSSIDIDNKNHQDFEIVHYNPKELMVLFVMYKENFNKQSVISDVIRKYTKGNL